MGWFLWSWSMTVAGDPANHDSERFGVAVRRAVIWRSGGQAAAQLVQWTATFFVIRLLSPADYGLFAMTQVALAFLNLMNGHGLASALVREPAVEERQVRQLFGMLLLINGALALCQLALAPAAAAYYRHPQVADLMRAQALLYLFTPFAILPQALLSRRMDFRHQARANLAAAALSAVTAVGTALAGWGVWTLVATPIVIFATRAAVLTLGTGPPPRPSFDFRGAGPLARFGVVMAGGQFFWFLQSQVDVFVAGRLLGAHALGVYTTALFLAQIFVGKLIPPLNEVAFSAYARLHAAEPDALPRAFLRAVRVVMAAALPFYAGLAVTAEPLVLTALGSKWAEVAPVVGIIALAMPFMTLQALITPACDASGRPGVGVRNGAVGALLLGGAFLLGVRWGPTGLAWSWVVAYPLYLAFSLRRALPVIGTTGGRVARAVAPSLAAAAVMTASVALADSVTPAWPVAGRLGALVAIGVAAYALALLVVARGLWRELVSIAHGSG